jgi:hypothetical protein
MEMYSPQNLLAFSLMGGFKRKVKNCKGVETVNTIADTVTQLVCI